MPSWGPRGPLFTAARVPALAFAPAPVSPIDMPSPRHPDAPARRRWLQRSAQTLAGASLAAWLPLDRLMAATPADAFPGLPAFPSGLTLYRQRYQNWARDIVLESAWTCAPRSGQDVVDVVNWARQAGYRVRPRGMMHNWSPLTVAPGAQAPKVILLDTTAHLNDIDVDLSVSPPRVHAGAGATLEALLTRLEADGLGMTATPAPGDVTLGGLLAIDGHGTAVPAVGEAQRQPGLTFGSLSNQILALTAVVFDPAQDRYVLRRFERHEPDIGALLAHVGRAFVVSFTLQAGANQRLLCKSHMDIPWTELFGPPNARSRTFASFLDRAGRAEAIWFPFTSCPWLKVWSVCPQRPAGAREVHQPFNYPFSDNLPTALSDMGRAILNGLSFLSPAFGRLQHQVVTTGLFVTGSYDLWGWSKNLLLYVKPTTLRVTANGYAVVTRRDNVQAVIHEFATHFQARLEAHRRRFQHPMNGPVEIRVTGLDDPRDVAWPGAVAPMLSAVRPRPDRPDWDVAVWFDLLTMPGTPHATAFYREIEQWMLQRFNDDQACMRVEWSKGWGYSDQGAWDDEDVLRRRVPASLSDGQTDGGYDQAVRTLDRLDPHRVFASPLLDRLMVARG